MRVERGLWWNESDIDCAAVLFEQVASIQQHVMPHVNDRSTCVQAGGNCGLFPLELVGHFSRVITAEPDPDNYAALAKNVAKYSHIQARHCAWGLGSGPLGIVTEEGNCGATYMWGGGNIPQERVDDLGLRQCGLIYLDVEGYEEFVLRGAEKTIEFCRPTIVVEMKNLSHRYGKSDQSLSNYLISLNYYEVHHFDNDVVWRHV